MSVNTIFYNTLVEFLQALAERFPEKEGVKRALSTLNMCASSTQLHPQMRQAWATATESIQEQVRDKDAEVVSHALDSDPNPLISGIGARDILVGTAVDELSKENVWKFLQTLTTISHSNVMRAPHSSPPKSAKAAAPDVNGIVDGFTKAMPKVMDNINDMLKQKEGENPLGDLIKQMMNPGQTHTGVTGNVVQNMIENTDQTVMQQASIETGLTVEDIVYRLNRLENLEKSRAYRRQRRTNNK